MKFKVTIDVGTDNPTIYHFDYCEFHYKEKYNETRVFLYDMNENLIDWFTSCTDFDIKYELNE